MMTLEKDQLRERYCDIREGLSEREVAEASEALCRRLGRMSMLQEAGSVLSYLAFKNELDLGLLFDLLPSIHWVLPRIAGKRLILHPYEPEKLVRHPYGMLEPPADAPVVPPEELDLILVPGVSFDPSGGRLGFGGGFYDRFLVRTPAIRVGICHDSCLAERLPCADHDQRMDWVVTPSTAMHCAPLWRRQAARLDASDVD
ncbi:MAG: 5-formyltetrahydrofolate cyclo-ligase [Anaerolineae bacterium]|jgi:5-formyltetrahydrofolate cyclo-ligase